MEQDERFEFRHTQPIRAKLEDLRRAEQGNVPSVSEMLRRLVERAYSALECGDGAAR